MRLYHYVMFVCYTYIRLYASVYHYMYLFTYLHLKYEVPAAMNELYRHCVDVKIQHHLSPWHLNRFSPFLYNNILYNLIKIPLNVDEWQRWITSQLYMHLLVSCVCWYNMAKWRSGLDFVPSSAVQSDVICTGEFPCRVQVFSAFFVWH